MRPFWGHGGPGHGPWHHHHDHHRGHHGWRGLRHELRLYYGVHLHRRLFFWFGMAIIGGMLATGVLGHFATGRGVFGKLLFIGVPALVLWKMAGKVARRIAHPLYELVEVSDAIGKGNLAARAGLHCGGLDEIATLARSVNDMAARIERQLGDQRELLAAVSHELRTPLARVRILLDIAREQGANAQTYDEVERELVEMDRLVGELLASARLDFQALRPKPLDAVDVARRALERAGLPEEKLVAVVGAAPFAGDPTLVGRALANLLDNAKKHGRGLDRLRVSARPGVVVFEVEDRGPGFPAGSDGRVFEAFARAPSDATDGRGAARGADTSLGLGLSLVDRIARAHGGDLRAERRPEGGARVTLTLAARPPTEAPAAGAVSPP